MTWEEVLKKDQAKLNLSKIDTHNRFTWKRVVFKKASLLRKMSSKQNDDDDDDDCNAM